LGERVRHLSGLHFKVSDFRSIVGAVPRGGRYFIWSFPSYLSWLANQLKVEGGLAHPPAAVIAFGETLSPTEAARLSDFFGTSVVNHYSMWEIPHLAQSCPDHPESLHQLGDRAIVRVARPDGSDADVGEIGRLLITNLTNYVMPFINYDTGDLAARGEPCPCGRGFQTLQALHGRSGEIITTPSGQALSAVTLGNHLVFVLHAQPYLWEYQLVQVEPDRVVLRVVPTDAYSPDFEAVLRTSLTELFRGEMRVEVMTVDRIDHEPSGKRLLTKVELAGEPSSDSAEPSTFA
jgi:phenylacetate-CoA ligase